MDIAKFRDIHPGRRAWIIGNGPSLNKMDLRFLRDEISIGTNCIFLGFETFGFRPTYYTVEDPYVAEDNRRQIDDLHPDIIRFCPRDLSYCLEDGPGVCWIDFNRSSKHFPTFSEDCARKIYWGSTVTYLAIQLAFYMGCDPIILIGVDFDYTIPDYIENDTVVSREDDTNHFHPAYFGKGKRWHHPHLEKVKLAYREALRHITSQRRTIVNATVGGKLEVFPRADYRAFIPNPAWRGR